MKPGEYKITTSHNLHMIIYNKSVTSATTILSSSELHLYYVL